MKNLLYPVYLVTLLATLASACDDSTIPMTLGGSDSPIVARRAVCGDGIRAGAEECDDGNTVDGDGCSQFCLSELPSAGAPSGGAPEGGVLTGGEPVGGEPVAGEPVAGEPVAGEPVGGEPVVECMDDIYEDNDTLSASSPLNPRSLTEPLSLAICEGDDDFFIIQGCAGAELQVTLTQTLETSDLDIRLTAQDGRQFAASATMNPVESLRYTFSADHPAYLKVYGYQGSEGGYELSLSLSDCALMSECLNDSDCDAGERCESQTCVASPPPECTRDQDCLPDERCVSGACELAPPAPDCVVDLDCTQGERCINGSCTLTPPEPECEFDFECGLGERCLNGSCELPPPGPECEFDFECDLGERCDQGVCAPLPPDWCESDLDCYFLDVCVNNTCVPPPAECLQHSDCEADEVCNGGSCLFEPAECETSDACFLDGELCVSERCISIERESAGCVFDEDCGPLATCEAGSCVAPVIPETCSVDSDCGHYQLCSAGSCVYEADRIEDDDDLANAEPLSSNLYSHLTIEEGDEDWISVEVCAGGTLDAEIRFVDSLGDIDLALYDASELRLVGSGSVTDHERVTYQSDVAQLLYVKVYGWSTATNSYDLSIRVSGCGGFEQDELEENDRPNDAPILTPGLYSGLTITERDSDWYATDVCAGGTLSVNLLFSDAVGDIDMRLYNAQQSSLISSTSGSDDEALSYTSTSGERLYWRVYGFSGAENSYEMSVTIEGCSGAPYLEPDRLEDNDQYTGAELLTPNLYGDLTISGRRDDDWVTFDICAGGTGEVEIVFDDLESDLELELYDGDLNYITGSLLTSSPEQVSAMSYIDQRFYARVYGYRGDLGRYDLWVRVEGCP